MADEEPPVPQPPPFILPVVPLVPPVQLPAPSAQSIVQPRYPIQPGPMPQLNWSHFKPEFVCKPDGHPYFSRRCQSPEFLFNISR